MGEIFTTSLTAAIIIFCALSTAWVFWRTSKTKRIMRRSIIIQNGNVVQGDLSTGDLIGNFITSNGHLSILSDENGNVFQQTSQGEVSNFSLITNGTHYLVRVSGDKVLTLSINNQNIELTSKEGKAALKDVGQFLVKRAQFDLERCQREQERNERRKTADQERQTRSTERDTARILREQQRNSERVQREYDRDMALILREKDREQQRIDREYERETQSTKRDEERATQDQEKYRRLFGEQEIP